MESVPREVIKAEVLLQLPYEDIISYCDSSKTARLICDDPAFWINKFSIYYGLPLEAFASPKLRPGRKLYAKVKHLLEAPPKGGDPLTLVHVLIDNDSLDILPLLESYITRYVSSLGWEWNSPQVSDSISMLLDHALLVDTNVAKKIADFLYIWPSYHRVWRIMSYYYIRGLAAGDLRLSRTLKKYRPRDYDTGVWEAIRRGDIAIIDYTHAHPELGPGDNVGEVWAAIETGNETLVNYYYLHYPEGFEDVERMNEMVRTIIETGNLPALDLAIKYVGDIIDYSEATDLTIFAPVDMVEIMRRTLEDAYKEHKSR